MLASGGVALNRISPVVLDREAAGLEGGADSVKWEMIRHIAVVTPANRQKCADMVENISLPKLKLDARRTQPLPSSRRTRRLNGRGITDTMDPAAQGWVTQPRQSPSSVSWSSAAWPIL